jgi:PAS domain S-box-containing protein
MLTEGVKDYAIFMLDPSGQVTTWNDGAERVDGYGEGEILGRQLSVFYTDEDVGHGLPEEELRAAAAVGYYEREGLRVRKDGSTYWANSVITALRDERGTLKGFSVFMQDATGRRHADDVLRFLAECDATLSSSLDYRETLASVARLVVPTLADWCAVDVVEEDGSVERLAVAQQNPAKAALARELQERYPPDPGTPRDARKVLGTGEPDLKAGVREGIPCRNPACSPASLCRWSRAAEGTGRSRWSLWGRRSAMTGQI